MTSSLHLTRLLTACVPALVAAVLLQGCSFIFVDAPPTMHDAAPPPRDIRCTTSVAAPIVDTALGAFGAIRTGFALSADESDYHSYPISREADIAIGFGLTTLFTAAAVYGFINTNKCAHLKAEALESPPPRFVLPAPRMVAPPLRAWCSYDTQCKGDRICEGGRCVSPPPPRPPPVEQPPPAEPEPAPSVPPMAPSIGGGGEI